LQTIKYPIRPCVQFIYNKYCVHFGLMEATRSYSIRKYVLYLVSLLPFEYC
jgi:hypothetical protein